MAREGLIAVLRKILAGALACCALLVVVPARAAPVPGTILLPSVSAPPARLAYSMMRSANGIAGYVIELPGTSLPFTLRRTGGLTGAEDFDVVFYRSIDGLTGEQVGDTYCATLAPTCSGTIPSGARFAVVTLSIGANGSFLFTF